MNIVMTFKNFEPSDHLRQYAERRFGKLARFVHKSENVEMTAVLTVDKFRHKADVQFSGDNLSLFAVEHSSDMYATVDMVRDKLEAQLKKHAERMKEKRRNASKASIIGADALAPPSEGAKNVTSNDEFLIVEEDVEPKPMFAEEAALQLKQREDVVLIFHNAETDRVNVLYQRKQGGFGLIGFES